MNVYLLHMHNNSLQISTGLWMQVWSGTHWVQSDMELWDVRRDQTACCHPSPHPRQLLSSVYPLIYGGKHHMYLNLIPHALRLWSDNHTFKQFQECPRPASKWELRKFGRQRNFNLHFQRTRLIYKSQQMSWTLSNYIKKKHTGFVVKIIFRKWQ